VLDGTRTLLAGHGSSQGKAGRPVANPPSPRSRTTTAVGQTTSGLPPPAWNSPLHPGTRRCTGTE